MRVFTAFLLLGLLTFSFLTETGVLDVTDNIEVTCKSDCDFEKEPVYKQDNLFRFAQSYDLTGFKQIIRPRACSLFCITYDVEIRPPRV